jgi:hypothetical protein
MTTREHRFPVTGTPRLELRMPVGDVRIVDGDSGEAVILLDGKDSVLSRFIVEQRGRTIYVEPERGSFGWRASVDVTVRVGEPPEIFGRLTAADLMATVPLAALTVDTASGNVLAGDISGDATVRSASGDVKLGDVGGRLEVTTASGGVRAGAVAGAVSVRTASGDVHVHAASDEVLAKSASGDVVIGTFTGSRIDAKTLSGDTTIGVTGGRRFEVSFQTLSGDVRTDFPVSEGDSDGGSARLSIKSISGDIEIHAAR